MPRLAVVVAGATAVAFVVTGAPSAGLLEAGPLLEPQAAQRQSGAANNILANDLDCISHPVNILLGAVWTGPKLLARFTFSVVTPR